MKKNAEQTKTAKSVKRRIVFFLMAVTAAAVLTGCTGKQEEAGAKNAAGGQEEAPDRLAGQTALERESGKDAEVDFQALQAENPDIFAWLYVPDTGIDYPVLQSEEADDYYESHDASGAINESGAIYTELANLTNMCDFNTVLHGKTSQNGESGLFAGLYRFADPDYFENHEYAYLYLDSNVLTYEIFVAYERENTSLIRSYDFTYKSGCQQFLDDLYDTRVMGMNIRKGWEEEEVTPYHFLITLTTQKGENSENQFVVIAALVDDAAGTIDRLVE